MNKFIYVFMIILLFSSCKENKEKKLELGTGNGSKEYITLDLPENIFVNEMVNDTLYYKSPLDSIKLSSKDKRYVFLYVTTDTIKYESIDEIKGIPHQAFIEKEKGIIPFKFRFEKQGDNYLSGIIKDQVILPEYYKDGKARIITHESMITIRVLVKHQSIKKI